MLGKEDVEYILKRNDKLKETRALYEPLWEEIAQYILPRRVGIGYTPSRGAKQTTQIYDSTAIHANELLAASMHGTLTPSTSRWFSLKLRNAQLNKVREVMEWLEGCSDILNLAYQQSNFNSQIHEADIDLAAFGEGCILVEEKEIQAFGFNGFQFDTYHNAAYCTQENAAGFVDTLSREFELSLGAAYRRWGDKLPKKLVEKYETKQDERFKFLHFVCPTDKQFKGIDRPFAGIYLSLDEKEMISIGGYHEFPYLVPRWTKCSGEDYGRGPGHTALPDVKTLNKAKEIDLDSWAIDLYPPTFEKEYGVIGSLRLQPKARNVAKDRDAIWTLERNVRYDVSQIKEENLRTSIRQIFFSDQLKLQEGPEMTATEVHVRYELMERLLGPTMGRLRTELLNPLIERTFNMLFRAGVLPRPPAIIARMGVRDLDIEFEDPLAKAQRMGEMAATQKLYVFAGGIAQSKQDISALDNLDDDKAVRHAAEVLGVPIKILRSDEEMIAIREQRQKAMEAEKMKRDLMGMAQGLGAASPALQMIQEAATGKKEASA